MAIFVFTVSPDENNSALLKALIEDPEGGIPTSFTTATYSLYNEETKLIINSKLDVDVISKITAGGVFRFLVPATDNIIQSSEDVDSEDHLFILTVVYVTSDGNHQGEWSFRITVNNNKMT